MTQDAPKKIWWTAAEIADAALPDLPTTKRKVNARAASEGWALQKGKARRRKAKGGGMEYHYSLLPLRARLALAEAKDAQDVQQVEVEIDAVWEEYQGRTDAVKAKAENRLRIVRAVLEAQASGVTRTLAVQHIGKQEGVSGRTIWGWLELIENKPEQSWLAFLAGRTGAGRKKELVLDPEFVNLVKSDWLRHSGPSLTSCYDRAVRIAEREGLSVVPLAKIRRHFKDTVSKPTEVFLRKGAEALKRLYPHQGRDKSALAPLECVCGDYHKFDVFIKWPGEDGPVRAQMVAFTDVYSGKFLAWRLSLTANSHTVQLTLGDLIRDWGIPQSVLLDNGREFAAKAITGGTPTRFRFKIRDDDVPGLLPLMGTKVIWATPYSGQSKPIERAFRDLCDRVAKHPAFEGAYTGNRPDAKPENYGSRAIPLDEFEAVLDEEIAHHNARRDRRSEVANGRSFDEVFNAGYKTAPIRKASEEQLRMWLLGAEGVRGKTGNGELKLMGNRYWSEWMYRIAEKRVVARFDPDNLHDGVHVYDLTGGYLGFAGALVKGGFNKVEDARAIARKRGQYERAQKELARAQKAFTAEELAARLRSSGTPAVADDLPEADVVRLPTPHKNAPKPTKAKPARTEPETPAAPVANLDDRRILKAPVHDEDERPEERFGRAMAMEEGLEAGETLTAEQLSWLKIYQTSAEYRAHKKMREAFGGN